MNLCNYSIIFGMPNKSNSYVFEQHDNLNFFSINDNSNFSSINLIVENNKDIINDKLQKIFHQLPSTLISQSIFIIVSDPKNCPPCRMLDKFIQSHLKSAIDIEQLTRIGDIWRNIFNLLPAGIMNMSKHIKKSSKLSILQSYMQDIIHFCNEKIQNIDYDLFQENMRYIANNITKMLPHILISQHNLSFDDDIDYTYSVEFAENEDLCVIYNVDISDSIELNIKIKHILLKLINNYSEIIEHIQNNQLSKIKDMISLYLNEVNDNVMFYIIRCLSFIFYTTVFSELYEVVAYNSNIMMLILNLSQKQHSAIIRNLQDMNQKVQRIPFGILATSNLHVINPRNITNIFNEIDFTSNSNIAIEQLSIILRYLRNYSAIETILKAFVFCTKNEIKKISR